MDLIHVFGLIWVKDMPENEVSLSVAGDGEGSEFSFFLFVKKKGRAWRSSSEVPSLFFFFACAWRKFGYFPPPFFFCRFSLFLFGTFPFFLSIFHFYHLFLFFILKF